MNAQNSSELVNELVDRSSSGGGAGRDRNGSVVAACVPGSRTGAGSQADGRRDVGRYNSSVRPSWSNQFIHKLSALSSARALAGKPFDRWFHSFFWVVVVLALCSAAQAGQPNCPPACQLPPGKQVAVSLEWRPPFVQASLGATVNLGLYAVAADAQPPAIAAGIQAIVLWDPQVLALHSLVDDSPYDWLSSGFPNDSALDDLNHDAVAPAGVPDNDGDAIYEALADFPKPIGDGPALIPQDGLRVATFRFTVLAETAGTQISIPEARGQFSCTAVFIGNGKVAGCDIKQDLGHATVTTQDVPLAIVSSEPPDGAIDARQPSSLDGAQQFGWDSIALQFGGDAAAVSAKDLQISSGCGTAPGVLSISPKGQVLVVQFDDRIPPGAWTTIRHLPSDTSVRIGFLPADVNGDGTSAALDILSLIDDLNGIQVLPPWSTDIDRSNQTNQQDILRVVDLLNGAGDFDPWNQVSICE